MTKTRKSENALKKTRKLFKSVKLSNCETSDSEESISSVESGDLAHIPIKNTPSLENLSLNEGNSMEQFSAELQKMMQLMESFAAKQKEHDTMFGQIERHLNATATAPQPAVQPMINVEQLYKIPDPIKMLPTFDGNSKQLHAWLTTAEETLNAFKDHVTPLQLKMYVTAVTNKIQGRAKDIICLAGNPDQFSDIKEVLINALGDRQELSTYKCQLWQCRMTEGMSIKKYYNKSKAILQNIKTLAKQTEKYRNNWEVINDFIEEDALAAFIAGLNEPYFGYAQAARPKDVEDAYAFLCKFKSKEITAHSMTSNIPNVKHQKQRASESRDTYKTPRSDRNQKPEKTDEPMDATTTRSRLTINKKIINNHEVSSQDPEEEILEESNSDSEFEDNLDLNFHLGTKNLGPT